MLRVLFHHMLSEVCEPVASQAGRFRGPTLLESSDQDGANAMPGIYRI